MELKFLIDQTFDSFIVLELATFWIRFLDSYARPIDQEQMSGLWLHNHGGLFRTLHLVEIEQGESTRTDDFRTNLDR